MMYRQLKEGREERGEKNRREKRNTEE